MTYRVGFNEIYEITWTEIVRLKSVRPVQNQSRLANFRFSGGQIESRCIKHCLNQENVYITGKEGTQMSPSNKSLNPFPNIDAF